ncbi:hypothetical protein ACQJBY_072047 [Aegilops geniculata]
MSPFKAMFGHEPKYWGISASTSCSVPSLSAWLEERAVMQDLVQQHLHRAKNYMKTHADQKRSFREFEVGDQFYLKLQPYIQTSVAPRANHKLSFKFYGPFPIIQKINAVAYKLQLPPQATVHPVFHVSQLRRALSPGTTVQPELPYNTNALAVPGEILQSKWRRKNGDMIEQVKVRWTGASNLDDTWEDRQALQARFPHVTTWGQAATQGGGDVSDPDGAVPQASKPHQEEARPSRAKKPNPRYTGPEWATAKPRST